MKLCLDCQQSKPVEEFCIRQGKPSWQCRTCAKAYMKDWRQRRAKEIREYNKAYAVANPEWARLKSNKAYQRKKPAAKARVARWKEANPEKRQAHALVRKAVKSGELVKPSVCEDCDRSSRLDAHHHDYTKPLQVRWLCKWCHRKVHNVAA